MTEEQIKNRVYHLNNRDDVGVFFAHVSNKYNFIILGNNVKNLVEISDFHTKNEEAILLFSSLHNNNWFIAIPKGMTLSEKDWLTIHRQPTKTLPLLTLENTLQIEENKTGYIWFPETEDAEIEEKLGIKGTPTAYMPGLHGFEQIEVKDSEKAGKFNNLLKHLQNKALVCNEYKQPRPTLKMEDIVRNPDLLSSLSTITVGTDCKTAHIEFDETTKTLVHYPIRDSDRIICPKNLVEAFLIEVTEAKKQFELGRTPQFTIGYSGPKYVTKTDCHNLTRRNINAEKSHLENMYGPLPENWEQFSTLQLKEYFSLQNRLNEGSITDIRNIYQFLPKDHRDDIEHSLQFHGHIFKKWLQKENHLFTCPVTNKEYATNFRSIDDLAEIPGFIDTLKNCIGKDNWILKVITSKKIQEAALAEVI